MTPASPVPIVYVEANWVVACIVTHDDHHKAALKLLEQAENGECELRIPLAAILESKHAVESAWYRLFKQMDTLRKSIMKGYRNGAAPLKDLDAALEAASKRQGVSDYMSRAVEDERQLLLKKPCVQQFSDVEAYCIPI